MTVRLSDEATSFLDALVSDGVVKSRAAGLDRMVRQEIRRRRAQQDAQIYASQGEDPDLAGLHEASLAVRRAPVDR